MQDWPGSRDPASKWKRRRCIPQRKCRPACDRAPGRTFSTPHKDRARRTGSDSVRTGRPSWKRSRRRRDTQWGRGHTSFRRRRSARNHACRCTAAGDGAPRNACPGRRLCCGSHTGPDTSRPPCYRPDCRGIRRPWSSPPPPRSAVASLTPPVSVSKRQVVARPATFRTAGPARTAQWVDPRSTADRNSVPCARRRDRARFRRTRLGTSKDPDRRSIHTPSRPGSRSRWSKHGLFGTHVHADTGAQRARPHRITKSSQN